MLKNLRAAAAILVFCFLTFYFLDFANILSAKFNIFARLQFIPALMSRNIVIIFCLIFCALLFGRIYCSFLCPLGIFQDIVIRCSKNAFSKKKIVYKKNNFLLRFSIVIICAAFFFFNFTIIIAFLDPYSVYGRIVLHLFKPVYLSANNILSFIFNHFGNYTFYQIKITMLSVFSFVVALFSFVIIGVLALKNGRLYCNSICPVGAVFGFINKYSIFKIQINGEKCANCGTCAKNCKTFSINSQEKKIDYSRCVNCFNCINSCPQKAIFFCANKNKNKNFPPLDANKRKFLLFGLSAIITAPVAAFAQTKEKLLKNRKIAISPPGSISAKRLLKHCTSCHLCVSKCPSKVLKPSFSEYGAGGILIPIMDFERGFCNFDCTICTEVCPNNALVKLTKEQKHSLQVGRVVLKPELCIVHTQNWNCGACSEHCPTQAVKMIPYKDGLTTPFIDADICVGCGGCEFICPVRPQRAIYVEGNEVHRQARAFDIEEKDDKEITDFGF